MTEIRNIHRVLVRKPESKGTGGGEGLRVVFGTVKIYFKEVEYMGFISEWKCLVTSSETVSFSRRTLEHGVSSFSTVYLPRVRAKDKPTC